jgi:serine/threonine protein kinase
MQGARSIPQHGIVYKIEGYVPVCLFARGGMAQVYLAKTRTEPPRLVAIKTLQVSSLDDPDRIAMFADEMRIARLLRHPNIVELVEAGIIDGEPFLVLEFIDGPSLRDLWDWAQERGRLLDPRLVVSLIAAACDGLHFAHDLSDEWGTPLQLIHRDISPQNLMVDRQGKIRVLDFGVAKAVGQRHRTLAQSVKGKMAYTAPEYVMGATPDRRADIFGLGVVLWELLTNHRLFNRATTVGTMQAVIYDPIPPPSSLVTGIPPALDDAVLEALRRNVDDRWPSALAMGTALERALAELGGTMPPDEIARSLAGAFSDVLESEDELRADMTDQQLSRGATRPSLAAVAPPDDADEVPVEWSSLDIDLGQVDESPGGLAAPATVVDVKPAWMKEEE